MLMYEFVSGRLIPGCTHRETGDTPAAVREKALAPLHERHGMEYLDGEAKTRLGLAIVPGQAR